MSTLYNPQVVNNGLVLYFDAANVISYPRSGTTWNDLSGNNNTGTLVNGPTFSSSNAGHITFDGVNDTATFGTTFADGFSTITVQSWFRPQVITNTFSHIVGADDNSSSAPQSVFLLTVDRLTATSFLPASYIAINVAFGVRTTGQTATPRTRPIHVADVSTTWPEYLQGMAIAQNPVEYAVNRWICVTGVYTGTETLIYINGDLRGSSTSQPDGVNRSITGNLNTSAISRTIAAGAGVVSPFTGNIGQIVIYNRALSAQQVLQNFNATRSRFGV